MTNPSLVMIGFMPIASSANFHVVCECEENVFMPLDEPKECQCGAMYIATQGQVYMVPKRLAEQWKGLLK